MAIQEKLTLKNFFRQGDIPTESNYVDLIDSLMAVTGNTIGNIDLTGQITASGNISSSGDLTIKNVFMPADSKISFDDTLDGTDQFITGNDNQITINGDHFINLTASTLVKTGTSGLLVNDSADSSTATLQVFGDVWASGSNGHITASGNISSSGNIIGDGLKITPTDTSEDTFHYVTFQKTGLNLTNVTNGFAFNPSTDQLKLGAKITLQGDAGHVTASGNISASGALIGNSLTLGSEGIAITATATEINLLDGVIANEMNQIKNINSNTITNTQWGYVGNMNQNVTTTSAVAFAAIRLTKTDEGTGTFGGTINVTGQSFSLRITSIPVIPGKGEELSTKLSTVPTLINAEACQSTSVILITCADALLSATAFNVTNGSFRLSIANENTAAFEDSAATFNFTIF